VLHGVFFWAHLVLVFGLLVYLGYSKHLHNATAAVNVALREEGPKRRLRPIRHRRRDVGLRHARSALRAAALEHFS